MTRTAKALRIHHTGSPEALVWEDVEVGQPGPGEVLLRQTAVGLNFIDVYHRTGLYPLPQLPATLGREAAGVVEAVGAGVSGLAPGSRVGYVLLPGAYTQARLAPAERLIPLPDGLDDRTAAAVLLKGLTAYVLLHRVARIGAGDVVLIHAAAGGVGLLLCQWARHLGATVIGTVGSEEKADLARRHGCEHPVLYEREDLVARVRALTGGRGVRAVFDSVGRATFERSLDCLAPLGILVSFGQSSGAVPPFNVTTLADKGSLWLTRPTLATYVADRTELLEAAERLFDALSRGILTVSIGQTYPLAEGARAHRDLEARRTRGATILLPWWPA